MAVETENLERGEPENRGPRVCRRNGKYGTRWNEEAEPRDPAFVPCLAAPGYFQAHTARALSSPTPRAAFTEEQTPARRPEIVQTSAQSHPFAPLPLHPHLFSLNPQPFPLIPKPFPLNPQPFPLFPRSLFRASRGQPSIRRCRPCRHNGSRGRGTGRRRHRWA